MPIYEYQCPECLHLGQFLENIDDHVVHECYMCLHAVKMIKLMSAPNGYVKGGISNAVCSTKHKS